MDTPKVMTRCRNANANADVNADADEIFALMLVMLNSAEGDAGDACVCVDVVDNAMLCAELCTALSDTGAMHVDAMWDLTLLGMGKVCNASVHAMLVLLPSM